MSIKRIATIFVVVAFVVVIAAYSMTYFEFARLERLSQRVQLGESVEEVDRKLVSDFSKVPIDLDLVASRFSNEELNRLADSGATAIAYREKGVDFDFFWLIFDSEGTLIHKFTPGI